MVTSFKLKFFFAGRFHPLRVIKEVAELLIVAKTQKQIVCQIFSFLFDLFIARFFQKL